MRRDYQLTVDAPFVLNIWGKKYKFQCRIRGYGAKRGMVIDKDWSKIEPVMDYLVNMGFGFSCFDIEGKLENIQAILEDWGKID